MGNVLCCVDDKRNYGHGEHEDYGELAQDTSNSSHIKALPKHPVDNMDTVFDYN